MTRDDIMEQWMRMARDIVQSNARYDRSVRDYTIKQLIEHVEGDQEWRVIRHQEVGLLDRVTFLRRDNKVRLEALWLEQQGTINISIGDVTLDNQTPTLQWGPVHTSQSDGGIR